uniref:Uncharacterized protein n=1 Tax=Magallana gigas TaxID=29159 RepID=A0A8W8NJM6_MAGGI
MYDEEATADIVEVADIETDKDFCEKQSEKGSKEDKKKTEAVVPSIVSETLTRAPVQHNQEEIPQTDSVQRQLPRKNDKIKYKLPNSDEWTEAKVLGRAGKATGRYPSWFNVRNSIDNEDKSVDLDKVEWKAVDEEKVNIADINVRYHKRKSLNMIRALLQMEAELQCTVLPDVHMALE